MALASVDARIRFVKDSWKDIPGIPRIDSRDERRANTEFQDVRIIDARPLQERAELGLDTNGFILTRHETALADFSDRAAIATTYLPEMCALIASLAGAEAVFPVNYLIRSEKPLSPSDWVNAYARYMHLDYNEPRALDTMREHLVRNGYADAVRAQSFEFDDPLERLPYAAAIYGCWQPIEREVQRNPLTLIDARSLEDRDLVDYIIEGSLGALPVYRPEQRLYYFPRMQTDEIIVFKHMDTRAGHARWCPHTSFDDPNSPADPLGRRSIETRVVAVFGRSH
jgi:hypothetical protein